MAMQTINPVDGNVVATFEELSDATLEAKLEAADKAFRHWRRTPVEERAAALRRIANKLLERKEHWARLLVTEMGKTYASAIGEVEKCALNCHYYADNGAEFIADETLQVDGYQAARVCYQPLGVVLAVMPWNYPFWQVFRFLAPALVAGNAAVLKHASNVPQSALAIEEVVRAAGVPEGVFQTLMIGSSRVARVIEDPRIAAVTLTGGENAGVQVAVAAGRALKKCVLELGGSDPFIVMPSADLDKAARAAVTSRTLNNGQSCIAAKRFIVHQQVHDDFCDRVVSIMGAMKIGDPMRQDTEIGPLATKSTRDDLESQLRRSIAAGAKVLLDGGAVDGPGYFFRPALIAEVPEEAPTAREELFGPVAVVVKARDIDHAIAVANDTVFGLGSNVWTNDPEEEARFIADIEAGQTFFNAFTASHPRLPFGGIKRSGYGRELGRWGLLEFVNVKTVTRAF